MQFGDLLQLNVRCDVIASGASAALVIGPARAGVSLAERQRMPDVDVGVFIGLAVHTSPFPVLLQGLITERGAPMTSFGVFGWIEDHFTEQPRADILGLLPTGEQPLLFLRDLDLDRPPEAYIRLEGRWLRVVAVLIARDEAPAGTQALEGDAAALAALEVAAPDATAFTVALRDDVANGLALRAALRARRKTAHPALLAQADGWRVLAQAARTLVLDAGDDVADAVRGLLSA